MYSKMIDEAQKVIWHNLKWVLLILMICELGFSGLHFYELFFMWLN